MASFYISSQARWRSAQFDRIISHANEALTDPILHERLGDLATGLAATVDSYFLPNVRHGRLSRPKGAPDEGHALVPLTSSLVPTIRMHRSLLQQSPSRQARNGLRDEEQTVNALYSTAKVRIATTAVHYGKDDGYIVQPVVMLSQKVLENDNLQTLLPTAVLHETKHVIDIRAAVGRSQIKSEQFAVDSELTAYHIGVVAFQRQCELAEPTAEAYERMAPSLRLEAARQELCDPAAPFTATPLLRNYVLEHAVN